MTTDSPRLPRATLAFVGLALLLLPLALREYSGRVAAPAIVAVAAAHHLCAMLAGSAVLRRIAPSLRGLGERWLLGWAVGLGLFGFVFLAIAHLGLFRPGAAWLVLVMGLLGALSERADLERLPREIGEAIGGRWTGVWVLLAAVVVALSAAPPTFYDACSYHVALPAQWMEHGRAVISRHFIYSVIPLNAELAMSPLLLLTGVPDFVNAGSGLSFVLLIALTAATANRLTRGAGGVTATVVATMPIAWFLALGTKSDLHMSIHALALLYTVALLREPPEGQSAAERARLLGLFAGLMIATKTTALAQLPFVLVLIIALPQLRMALGGARGVAAAASIAALLGSPTYLQNFLLLGNPVFPALSSVFGGAPESAKVTGILAAWNTVVAPADLWRFPWDLTFTARDPTMNNLPGPLLLLCAPVAFLLRPLPRPLSTMLLCALVTVPAWLLTQSLLRYNPLVWLSLALLAGWVMHRLQSASVAGRVAVGGVVLVSGMLSTHWTLQAHESLLRRPSSWIVGGQTREEFLLAAFEPFAVYTFINQTLPRDAVILPMSDPRLLYLERRAILSELQARPAWDEAVNESSDAQDLLARLRALGASHLLFSEADLARVHRIGWGPWDEATSARVRQALQLLGPPLFDDERFQLWKLPDDGSDR